MIRRAILVCVDSSPSSSVPGGVARFRDFLCSNLGGGWAEDEIEILVGPTLNVLHRRLFELQYADYSFTYYLGATSHSNTKTTCLPLGNAETISLKDLIRAGARKRTVLVNVRQNVSSDSEKSQQRQSEPGEVIFDRLDVRSNARQLFDDHLKKCPPGCVELYAFERGERSTYDFSCAPDYLSSLIGAVEIWAESYGTHVMSVRAAHRAASEMLKLARRDSRISASYLSGDIQFPLAIR